MRDKEMEVIYLKALYILILYVTGSTKRNNIFLILLGASLYDKSSVYIISLYHYDNLMRLELFSPFHWWRN